MNSKNENNWQTVDGMWIADGTISAYTVDAIVEATELPATYLCLYRGRLKKLVVPKGQVLYHCTPTQYDVNLLSRMYDYMSHLSEDELEMLNIEHVLSLLESHEALEEELEGVTMDSVMERLLALREEEEETADPVISSLIN